MTCRLAGLAVSVVFAAVAGCQRTPAAPARATPNPQQAAVLRFWERAGEATALRLRGQLPRAVQAYEQALLIDPRHEDSLYYLGQCRRDLGHAEEAREAFSRLVAANPNSARGHLALGALLASPDRREPMDLEAAERHLLRAHEINKEETGAMVRLGEILILRGRPEQAREWLEAATRTNAKSVEAAFLAGYLYWERGDLGTAARFFEKAREATRADVPTRGVLNEGDRRPANRSETQAPVLAPPLLAPMGRTLLGEFSEPLRATQPSADIPTMTALYRALREARPGLTRRGKPPGRAPVPIRGR